MKMDLQRATYIFGIVMAGMMALSLVLPAITRNRTATQPTSAPPTSSPPPPTQPPPITDFSTITFDEEYLHPSGLYAIGVPSGWTVTQPSNSGTVVRTTMSNSAAVSVIEFYMEKPSTPVTTTDELSAHFSENAMRSSWSQYRTGFVERSRQIVDNKLVVDFQLGDAQQRQYIARHTAWIEGDWIYVSRVVVPTNAQALLFFLIDALPEHITFFPQFDQAPVAWNAFYDEIDHHIIRYPTTWIITDGTSGEPVSFESDDFGGVRLLVEVEPTTVADEQAARDLVEASGSNITISSVEPLTREGGEGFSVAYEFRNPDGDGVSGLALLLNGSDEKLHVANLQLAAAGVDLNTDEARQSYARVVEAMDTFSLLTGLNLATPTPEPTAADTGS